jgi:hypothetical protein
MNGNPHNYRLNHLGSVRLCCALLTLAGAGAGNVMASNEFDYASTTGSTIKFIGGGQFDFTPTSGAFQITDSSLGTSANGFTGSISGTYTMGTIVNMGGGFFEAPVTGSGTFTIIGGGGTFTGTLTWINIEQAGTGNALNYLAAVDFSNLSYTGTNPELLTLAGQGSVVNNLNFTEVPAQSLATLEAGGSSLSTSFSGAINPPISVAPEPGTLALGVVGASIFLFRSRK